MTHVAASTHPANAAAFLAREPQAANLADLGAQFDTAAAAYLAADAACSADETPENEALFNAAGDRAGDLADAIADHRATSFADLLVKARALAWCTEAVSVDEGDITGASTDRRLMRSILNDLLALATPRAA